jgi:predicted ATPase
LAGELRVPQPDLDAFVEAARRGVAPVLDRPHTHDQPGLINLPAPPTTLVCREHETQVILKRLLAAQVRLLTLVGPPGIGKTRLSINVAVEAAHAFTDGVHFVELAPLRDPELVTSTIGRALGLNAIGKEVVGTALQEFLKDKNLLLVLDNFEHLLDAAPTVGKLLLRAPAIKVLVTSRERLEVYGENTYAVPALDTPDTAQLPSLEHLREIPAIQLFVDRAQAARFDFELTEQNAVAVARICQRLEGLPLALELAAARLQDISPQLIVDALTGSLALLEAHSRDLPPRQRTMRGAIEWSYQLLSEPGRALFLSLGVFTGSWSLEAAEAVCGPRGENVSNTLGSLVAANLIGLRNGVNGEARYTMLEPIRAYGLEQLEASGEAADVRRRHAEYYAALAEAAEPKLHGREQAAWLDRLEAEHDNLRAVLAWSQVEPSRAEIGLRLAGALRWFWIVRASIDEGGPALAAGLAANGHVSPAVRMKALRAAGQMAQYGHDFERSIALFEESIALARSLGDQRGAAEAISLLGETVGFQGDAARGIALMEESLAIQRQLGDTTGSYHTLFRLAEAAATQGQLDRATELHEQSLAMRREVGDTRGMGSTLKCLGVLALARGDHEEAARRLNEAVATYKRARMTLGIANCLEALAGVAIGRDEPLKAVRLLGAVDAVLELAGGTLHWGERARFDRYLNTARSRLDEHSFSTALAEGRAMGLDQAVAYAADEAAPT